MINRKPIPDHGFVTRPEDPFGIQQREVHAIEEEKDIGKCRNGSLYLAGGAFGGRLFRPLGDSAGIRTQDPYIKSVLLYQLSYGIVWEG